MIVTIHLKETSKEISYGMAENAYVKGPFYCIMFTVPTEITEGELPRYNVHKYPVADIFRVTEEYGTRSPREHG